MSNGNFVAFRPGAFTPAISIKPISFFEECYDEEIDEEFEIPDDPFDEERVFTRPTEGTCGRNFPPSFDGMTPALHGNEKVVCESASNGMKLCLAFKEYLSCPCFLEMKKIAAVNLADCSVRMSFNHPHQCSTCQFCRYVRLCDSTKSLDFDYSKARNKTGFYFPTYKDKPPSYPLDRSVVIIGHNAHLNDWMLAYCRFKHPKTSPSSPLVPYRTKTTPAIESLRQNRIHIVYQRTPVRYKGVVLT